MLKNLLLFFIVLFIAIFAYFSISGSKIGEIGERLYRYNWPFKEQLEGMVEERKEIVREEAEREKEQIKEEVREGVRETGKSLWERLVDSLFTGNENDKEEDREKKK